MCGRGNRKSKNKNRDSSDNGFEEWGGYMAAKRAKLADQFHGENIEKVSTIFSGVSIIVNGLTHPPAVELKKLMAAHGGEYHIYQSSSTTHIIASNLPNVKIKHIGAVPIVKPAWITESIALNKLLDYKRYLLYNNQSRSQPALKFPIVAKSESSPDNKHYLNTDDDSLQHVEERDELHDEKKELTTKSDVTKDHSNSVSSRITKTASDPRFLEEFYNNSRLHLISTLGAEFKQLLTTLREKSDGRFVGKEKLIAQGNKQKEDRRNLDSVIMHIDMDCFFVSVGLRNHPELKGKPVAITHAKSGVISNADPNRQASRAREFELYQERLPEGATSRVVDLTDKIDGLASMSEIASCSYEARQRGIKNGMFLGQAVQLCPELKTLPYDFEGYKEVSHTLYNTIASYTLDIEAVSCDEMYVDVTQILNDTGLTVNEWATHIRNEIVDITRCPCSRGFGANRLQARLATKKAKPAGQFYLKPDDVEIYMSDILVADLPGVGRATLAKLRNLGLNTCGDLQGSSLKVLQSELGVKLGKKIYNQAFGRDNKALEFDHERKSVSAEINYGIRFKTKEECYNFLQSLSNEVYSRLNDVKMRARNLTLKLLVRAEGAPVETAKFLGHGVCDAISKSSNSNLLYTNPEVIYREAKIIYDRLNIPFSELRGVGIQLTKLEKIIPTNKAMANFLKQTTVAKKSTSDSDKIIFGEYKASSSKDTENLDKIKNSTLIDNRMPDDSKIIDVEGDKPSTKKINTNFSKPGKSPIKTMSGKSRGRPKGSTSSRSRITPNGKSSIKHFLQKADKNSNSQVEEANKERETQAKLLEQIDMTVLNELPEEIRLEVLQEYGITSTKSNTIKNNTVVPVKIRTSEKNTEEKRTSSGHSPFTNLTWEQTKAGIKAWVKSENIPSSVDVDMLGDHLRQLALDRKLEVLQSGFNFLHRTFSTLDCAWHQAYFSIVNNVQQGMVARYGKTLYLVTAFHCCQIH